MDILKSKISVLFFTCCMFCTNLYAQTNNNGSEDEGTEQNEGTNGDDNNNEGDKKPMKDKIDFEEINNGELKPLNLNIIDYPSKLYAYYDETTMTVYADGFTGYITIQFEDADTNTVASEHCIYITGTQGSDLPIDTLPQGNYRIYAYINGFEFHAYFSK
jgi:hypothetical protein